MMVVIHANISPVVISDIPISCLLLVRYIIGWVGRTTHWREVGPCSRSGHRLAMMTWFNQGGGRGLQEPAEIYHVKRNHF